MKISVCIATYCRTERLAALLDDLVAQQRQPAEVVVVDNDAAGSARPVVDQRSAAGTPFPIHYGIQPVKNISRTRNSTVAMATGDWLAFVDDDERVPPHWLEKLAAAAVQFRADGVLGPVEPVLPANAPAWIRRGRFYDWPRMRTGLRVAPNRLRFGNVLLRGSLLRATPEPFDPRYGLTGGEDGDLLARLAQAGAAIIWCDEAPVQEPIVPARLSLRWLLRRALRGGQDFARHSLARRYGDLLGGSGLHLLVRATLQMLTAAALALVSWPAGRHLAAYWLLKASANLGKLSVFMGWHYREYGGKPT